MYHFDFLVIGGGIAGLTFALKVAQKGTVAVLFKHGYEESSTAGAQGGVAAVTSADDNYELHIEDTLTAGAGLCKRDVVEVVVKEGPERVKELIEMGANFDKIDDSTYHLHREGGHSRRRIYHLADATGYEIQKVLLRQAEKNKNITFFNHASAIDLISAKKIGVKGITRDRILGAYVYMNDDTVKIFAANKILVATGGAGKVYLYTSNPDVATGDGIAMCYRAGAPVANMEFFQFHPTCLYHPLAKSFLITEALRGEGAQLKRINGERFMPKYHELAELAPRDIVARAIDHEMKVHGEDHVLLDISYREDGVVEKHFPTIYEKCKQFGFNLAKAPIPVVPAAHYLCGGVVTDLHGATNLENLYVAGETACTGLHGANRLASNSLLEGLVFAHRAAEHALANLTDDHHGYNIPPWNYGDATNSDEAVVISQNWDEIRRLMWNYVGIVRSNKRLERALRRNNLIHDEINEYYWNFKISPDLLELRNISVVADVIIRSAMARHESRGLHYTLDYPDKSPEIKDTILYNDSTATIEHD